MATGYVLGVNIGFHDSSAALLQHGALRVLIEQERISRRKHAVGQPPADAIAACLATEGIDVSDLDAIAIGWDFRSIPLGRNKRFSALGLRKLLFPSLGEDVQLPPIRWIKHHIAHAASAYYSAGVQDAAVLVLDGAGETQATSIGKAGAREIEMLREWPVTESLGFFYNAAAEWAGLGYWGTGKLMGLAAYGRRRSGVPLKVVPGGYELVHSGEAAPVKPRGENTLGPLLAYYPQVSAIVQPAFAKMFPYAERTGEEPIAYADFAASVQESLEEAVLELAADLRRRVSSPVLTLSGGVAMNCTMVGRLVRDSGFDRVYVPPVPTDAGVSLGAALVVAAESPRFEPTVIDHAYWGPEISDAAEAAQKAGLVHGAYDETALAAALADGQLVGWARGRGEIGQRALGTRSIIADPRDRRNLERLNIVKGREMWRPVAPSILEEHLDEVITGPVSDPSLFMLAAASVRDEARLRLPATTHVDGTARPQAVRRSTNPSYWSLINAFRTRTGVPAVVNTSFNLAGEPIVNSADDAISTFVRAKELDLLVLDDRIVARSTSALPS